MYMYIRHEIPNEFSHFANSITGTVITHGNFSISCDVVHTHSRLHVNVNISCHITRFT